ncbi:Clavaminate synthase-like protein [Meredithblackwellia eburnea MCA 4105]
MTATKLVEREIPTVSMRDFEKRRKEIQQQIVEAAEAVGFFILVDHGITHEQIEQHFQRMEKFFKLSDETKQKYKNPNTFKQNVGYDALSQLRPSTGSIDQKETINLQLCRPEGWPSEEDSPGFSKGTEVFMRQIHEVSMRLMDLLEDALGLPSGTLQNACKPDDPESLTSLRSLHYLPAPAAKTNYWRNGPHADLSIITLLFQRENEPGLEICPGREAVTDFGVGDSWTAVPAKQGPIVINIGDMGMYWSNDRFKSVFHRVVAYEGEQPSRYSAAYFNHASRSSMIHIPGSKYPPMTGEEVMKNRMAIEFKK